MARIYVRVPEVERFYSFVRIDDKENCWPWQGARQNGYGKFTTGNRKDSTKRVVKAHVFSYETSIGPVPVGLVLDHGCDNRACVNPFHVEPKTNRANILRGTSPTAMNFRKTHCAKGHAFTDDNTLMRPWRRGKASGMWRRCRACHAAPHAKRAA